MNDPFRLSGEAAVVSGALGRLGPVWSKALLGAGANVLALDLPGTPPSPEFEKLAAQYDETRLKLATADVRDRPALEAACEECVDRFGVPFVLVNNAGIDRPPVAQGPEPRLEDIPIEMNRQIFDVNVLGVFLVSQVFGGRMVTARRGAIVNIGSLYASVSPDPRFYDHIGGEPPFLKPPAYGASKAAVVNLTRYLSTLWAPRGVRVNALSPGGVLGTQDEEFKRKFVDRVPLGRMATNEDLGGPLLFLASPISSYVTGIELMVDGGYTAW
ncbi:MAG: SDR family oxidoreductase [Myxococcota bacterium]